MTRFHTIVMCSHVLVNSPSRCECVNVNVCLCDFFTSQKTLAQTVEARIFPVRPSMHISHTTSNGRSIISYDKLTYRARDLVTVLVTRSSYLRDLLVRSVVLLLSCPTLPSLGVSEAAVGGRRVRFNTITSQPSPTNCEAERADRGLFG